jgi:UDP-glucose 4-epimerase
MKYVVTGGAGFIGSHIVEELVRRGHEVVIIDTLSTGRLENITPFLESHQVSFQRVSITDLSAIRTAFESVDGIFHEAAIASVPRSVADPLGTHKVNATGTLNVLVAARDCGVGKVVFASTAAVYGDRPVLPSHEDMATDPLSPYAASKLSSESYCSVFSRLYGMQCTSLRYFNVFGPRQDPGSPYSGVITKFIINTLGHLPLIIYGDGGQTRDFVYVKDVVTANLRAMESKAQGIFNIACGRRANLLTLAEMIMEITGINVPIRFEPPVPGDVRDSLADISRSCNVLGYVPAFTMRQGLKETITWFQENGPPGTVSGKSGIP